MSSQTPLMSQYLSVKREYPDSILLFRLGDFYEMFYDDAKTASEILGNSSYFKGPFEEKSRYPSVAFPIHSVEPYISKLLGSGKKVAICEQMGDPKRTTRGLVERSVVRVLTPGAVLDSENLESKSNNFLVCVSDAENGYALSFCDISTGEFQDIFFPLHRRIFSPSLRIVDPREILIPDSGSEPSLA